MSGIGEIFLSAALEPLITKLGSESIKFVTKHKRVRSSFTKLSAGLTHINSLLQDAEEKQYTEASVKSWLASLRDVADDLEDLLDDIIIIGETRRRRNFLRNIIFDHKMMSKISDITERLQEIRDQVNDLKIIGRKSGGSDDVFQKNVTRASKPHMLKDEYVVGRDEKKKEVIKMILESKDDDLLVIPIVGMGGIGKTTLAKAVYYDDQVEKHFDTRAMACVSTEFDILAVTQKIYRDVTQKEPKSKDLHTLQTELRKELESKKFLIVLDDVWNEIYDNWENLLCPFKGQPGSRIIVTTRKEDVAKIVRFPLQLPSIYVEKLNDEDCLSLMLHHAKISLVDNFSPEFESGAKQLMRKCDGLPLAAKSLGSILLSKDRLEDWEGVLHSNIWELPNNNTLPVLLLSYFDLPPHLKRMFVYSALFPQDYEFTKRQLVLLWMGEGFLDQHIDTEMKTKEEWGDECFDELVEKSFFQCSSSDHDFFVMHDLINDLACHIATERYCHWDHEKSLEKVRHCSILRQMSEALSEFKDFPEAKKLRTLLYLGRAFWYVGGMSINILPTLYTKVPYLRVLSLRGCCFGELPDSICQLTQLRHLDLSYSDITTLPNSLDCLIRLEVLSITGTRISKLPETLGNLRYLRHLDNSYTIRDGLKYIIPCEIGKLEHLQTLSEVFLSKERSFGLKELEYLKSLCGSLRISGLENVISIDYLESCLKEKKKLHELTLKWNAKNKCVSDEDVLERLCPPKELRKLTIDGFKGLRFPSWNGDHSYTTLSEISSKNFGKLVHLTLSECDTIENLQILPPNLRHLTIGSCAALRSLPSHISAPLESLSISRCTKLDNFPTFVFPQNLSKLLVCYCRKVKPLKEWGLGSLHNLKSFYIIGGFPELHELNNHGDTCLFPSSLNILHIRGFPKLVSLGNALENVTSLRELIIFDCEKLEELPCERVFRNLRRIDIIGCPRLEIKFPKGIKDYLKNKAGIRSVSHYKYFRYRWFNTYSSLDTNVFSNCFMT